MSLVVFDLDGTLVDSRLDLAESTNEMLASLGAPALPVDVVAAMVGDGARALVERALAAAGRDPREPGALERFLAIYDRRLLGHTRPYAGIPEVVRDLSRTRPLAVLTNKPGAPSRRLLDAFALSPFFTWVVGGDGPWPRKPDPAGLVALAALAGVETREVWLVGDSTIDVETARRAGARICVALYGFGRSRGALGLDGTETVVRTPAEIPAAIGAGPALGR